MRFCDEKIQKHLLNGGKITHSDLHYPIFLGDNCDNDISLIYTNEYDGVFDFIVSQTDLERDDWEIVEPKYDWNKIIKDKVLCVFYNANEDYKLGYIRKIWRDGLFQCNVLGNGILHIYDMKNCKPFNPAEFNIAKDLKEYEK